MSASLPARRPVVIQGGTGVGVSSWRLANAVARTGQLGVVTGSALEAVVARSLRAGDPDGHVGRAFADFPIPELAQRARRGARSGRYRDELTVLGSFVEVWLAREGHTGLVGVDLVDQAPAATPAAAYGAMLAGVDVVLAGAGVRRQVPHLLDDLAEHRPTFALHDGLPALRRPTYLAFASSPAHAQDLHREASTRPDGFVVEAPRDASNVAALAATGVPFWLAGGYGEPERVLAALDAGAAGVHVGTLFALARESGLREPVRERLLQAIRTGSPAVRTGGRGDAEDLVVTLGADLAGARRLDSERWLHGGSSDGWTASEAVAWLLRDVGVSR